MELNELQKKADEIIDKIDEKLNCSHDINSTILHLIEELGEVSRELNKPNIRNEDIDKEELGDEIADVFLLLLRIANLNDINLEESIKRKIEKLNKRHGFV